LIAWRVARSHALMLNVEEYQSRVSREPPRKRHGIVNGILLVSSCTNRVSVSDLNFSFIDWTTTLHRRLQRIARPDKRGLA
jgi:hypothetical protein